MKIDNINIAVLEMYKIKSQLESYEIDMGPNGSLYPMTKLSKELYKVIQYFERVYLKNEGQKY